MKTTLSIVLVVCAFGVVGCQPPDDGMEPEKPLVTFEGKTEPQYAATWKTSNGKSTYQLKDTGKYVLDSLVDVKGQAPMKTHSEGDWKVNGDRILFRDASGNVVPYAYEMKGDELTLTLTGSMKNKTVLRKQ